MVSAMASRISLKDAERLGLLPPGKDASPSQVRPRPRPQAPAAALPVPRKPAKGGRLRRDPQAVAVKVSFRVDAAPRTKQRARTAMPKREIEKAFFESHGNVARFRELLGRIRHHSFTPEDTKEFETIVGTFGARAMGSRAPFQCPVVMRVTLVMEGDEGTWPTDVTDPDIDNAVKAVFDGLNGIVYKDDRLVVGKSVWKVCGPRPYVSVSVRALRPSGG